MTNNMDSSLPEGSEGQPISTPSDGNVQPSSETVNVPKSEWEQIQKTIKRLDDQTRSDKDRAVKGVREEMKEGFVGVQNQVNRVLQIMEAHGLTKEDAINVVQQQDEDAETKRMIRELYQKNSTPTAGASGNVQASGGKVAEVVKEYGLDENDAEVIDIYRRYSDPNEQEKAALRLAAKRANSTTPSLSAAPTLQGNPTGVRMTQQEVEQLSAKRNQLFKEPTKNRAEIKMIEKRLVEAGIPID